MRKIDTEEKLLLGITITFLGFWTFIFIATILAGPTINPEAFNTDIPTPTPTPTPTPLPTMSEYYTLNEDIQTAPYSIYNYELDTFDCSDMSAVMCTHLDALGWDAHILALTGDGIYGHAMVVVYADKTYYIESTGKRITPALMNGYTIEGEYTDIVDAVENCRWGASEWGIELYIAERSKM